MATAPITSSPDPRCTLDLSVLPRDLWTFRVLPIIKTHDDLMASPWRAYLQRLYPELMEVAMSTDSSSYPIDMRCFNAFWAAHVPSSVRHDC